MGVGQHYNQAGWIGEHFSINYDLSINRGREQIIKWINIQKLIELSKEMANNDFSTLLTNINVIKNTKAEDIFSDKKGIIDKNIEKQIGVNDMEYHPEKRNFFQIFDKKDIIKSEKIKLYNNFTDFVVLHQSRNIVTYLDLAKQFKLLLNKKQPLIDWFVKQEYKEKLILDKNILEEYNNINSTDFKRIEKFCYKIFNFYYPLYLTDRKKIYHNINWAVINLDRETVGLGDIVVFDFSEKWLNIILNNYLIKYSGNQSVINIMSQSVFVITKKNQILWGYCDNTKIAKDKVNEIKNNITYFETYCARYLSIISFLCAQRHYVITSKENEDTIKNYINIAYQYLNHENNLLYNYLNH